MPRGIRVVPAVQDSPEHSSDDDETDKPEVLRHCTDQLVLCCVGPGDDDCGPPRLRFVLDALDNLAEGPSSIWKYISLLTIVTGILINSASIYFAFASRPADRCAALPRLLCSAPASICCSRLTRPVRPFSLTSSYLPRQDHLRRQRQPAGPRHLDRVPGPGLRLELRADAAARLRLLRRPAGAPAALQAGRRQAVAGGLLLPAAPAARLAHRRQRAVPPDTRHKRAHVLRVLRPAAFCAVVGAGGRGEKGLGWEATARNNQVLFLV